jgi:hypothetical protein
MPPPWLTLLAPLPAEVVPQRKPVASAEQLEKGTAGPIADWQSVTVNLSVPEGSRNVLITVDGSNKLLSAGDHVLFVREPVLRDGMRVAIYDHESVGGRYADDGSFHGTRWQTRTEQVVDSDDDGKTTSTPSTPSEDDIASLNRLVAEVMRRAGPPTSGV